MKGIAVPYIIALILGIVVVALIGYWFFVLGGGIPGQTSINSCNIALQKYCREWSLYNFDLGASIANTWDIGDESYSGSKGCKSFGVVASDTVCKQLFGVLPGTTTTPPTETLKANGVSCTAGSECKSGKCEDTVFGKVCVA